MEMISFGLCLTGAILLGAGGAGLVARYGRKLHLMDQANHRSSHQGSVPKGGGIGILATFALCSILLGVSNFFWMPAVFLSLVSLAGDRVDLPVFFRLFLQVVCAILAMVNCLPLTGASSAILFAFVVVFIVGTANIYNFMDGIDGIAGITGCVAFGLVGGYGHRIGADASLVVLSLSLALSCLAFLYFNLPVARVFMGDVASVLLGFVFALVVISAARNFLDFICMSGFLWLFYLDEVTTMAVRIKNGEALTQAHRKHLYQLLANEMGVAHWKISLGYGAIQLMIGLAAIFLCPYGILFIFLLYAVCAVVFFRLSNLVRKKAVFNEN